MSFRGIWSWIKGEAFGMDNLSTDPAVNPFLDEPPFPWPDRVADRAKQLADRPYEPNAPRKPPKAAKKAAKKVAPRKARAR